MIEYKLNIGDVVCSSEQVSYSCYGLGSCVGLFIKDRLTGQSAGAHIFLPDDEVSPVNCSPFSSATYAIEEILRQLKSHGSSLLALRAKLAGGANVNDSSFEIGERNAKSVIRELIERKIYIAASDLGGSFCRTTKFESVSGLLLVSKPQINQLKMF